VEALLPAPRFRKTLRTAVLTATILLIAIGPLAPQAWSQFLYLDSNGDGLSSPNDVLNTRGTATTISVYLDTDHNADGSVAFCPNGPDSLTINSYEIILHATGGTVTFTNYVNLQGTMTTLLGSGSSSTDFYVGFGGGSILSPGKYRLGTLTVMAESGSPTLNPAGSTTLAAHYETSFGTKCTGQDQDNTYKLGLDWHDISGCGPPGGGDSAPAVAVPSTTTVENGEAVAIAGEFSDLNGDSLSIHVQGVPPGLSAVQGQQSQGRKQVRLYGSIKAPTPEGTYTITWTASDGSSQQSVQTQLVATEPQESQADFEQRVRNTVNTPYRPLRHLTARSLGTRAVPILASMLRDEHYKPVWPQIAEAIGNIGDTAYFDTLFDFIRTRFRGTIDNSTFFAIEIAQSNLGPMATISPRALSYLIASTSASSWASLTWVASGAPPASTASELVTASRFSLAYTDSDQSDGIIDALPINPNPQTPSQRHNARFMKSLQDIHARVRSVGYVRYWQEEGSLP